MGASTECHQVTDSGPSHLEEERHLLQVLPGALVPGLVGSTGEANAQGNARESMRGYLQDTSFGITCSPFSVAQWGGASPLGPVPSLRALTLGLEQCQQMGSEFHMWELGKAGSSASFLNALDWLAGKPSSILAPSPPSHRSDIRSHLAPSLSPSWASYTWHDHKPDTQAPWGPGRTTHTGLGPTFPSWSLVQLEEGCEPLGGQADCPGDPQSCQSPASRNPQKPADPKETEGPTEDSKRQNPGPGAGPGGSSPAGSPTVGAGPGAAAEQR